MKKIFLLILLLICFNAYAQTYTVERVMDCNTLKLTSGVEVRLIGIECPEDEEMGRWATEFVQRYELKGNAVRLEFDVQERDKYGRLLAYVYFKMPMRVYYEDGSEDLVYGEEEFLNRIMMRQGYASPMTIPPNVKYADLFQELYEEARVNKRGLWRHTVESSEPIDCTMDAKQCPDGSYVGRVGPDCKFKACPESVDE